MKYQELSLFSEESNVVLTNPLKNRRIAIVGNFRLDQKIIRQKLAAMGAIFDNKVTKYTHYVLIGDNPSQEKMDNVEDVINRRGFDVKILREADLNNIMSGIYDGYHVDVDVKKNLTLTYEHVKVKEIKPLPLINPVLEENLYIPQDITLDKEVLAQIIGNIGAYANNEIVNDSESDKTKPIVMLSEQTIENLKSGCKDNTILYIEKVYNESKSDGLDYKFISEQSLLSWIRSRSELCGDTLTLSLLKKL